MRKVLWFVTILILIIGVYCANDDKPTTYSYATMKVSQGLPPPDPSAAATGNETKSFCIEYPYYYYNISTISQTVYKLENRTDIDPCNDDSGVSIDAGTDNKMIFLMKPSLNCTIGNYFSYTNSHKGSGFIMLLSDKKNQYWLNKSIVGTEEFYGLIKIDENEIEIGYQTFAQFFEIENEPHPVIIMLIILASSCVAIGALTSPSYIPLYERKSSNAHQQILDDDGNDIVVPSTRDTQFKFNIYFVICLVLAITTMLMTMYYFYDTMVKVITVFYCIGVARSMYEILVQVTDLCKMEDKMPKIKGCAIHHFILIAVSCILPIVWYVLRKEPNAYILANILGLCFCINLLQILKMPSLQICTAFLWSLFIYDIFFVFITPYFTKDGKSIMVEVATGGGSSEILPLLLQIPVGTVTACKARFALLGFGDIVLPGGLICFANMFDIKRGDKYKPYFITGMIGYVVGLTLAFVALQVTKTGQPALLYIVPCTLFPLYAVSLCRGQFGQMWKGVVTRRPELETEQEAEVEN